MSSSVIEEGEININLSVYIISNFETSSISYYLRLLLNFLYRAKIVGVKGNIILNLFIYFISYLIDYVNGSFQKNYICLLDKLEMYFNLSLINSCNSFLIRD